MVVVYPDAVWYAGVAPTDVGEIVDEHVVNGRPVARLAYPWPEG
jgi:(2Fe-2S) ferredoxin